MNPIGLDPLLDSLGNYGGGTLLHMLILGSPAIDGIVGSDTPSTSEACHVHTAADMTSTNAYPY